MVVVVFLSQIAGNTANACVPCPVGIFVQWCVYFPDAVSLTFCTNEQLVIYQETSFIVHPKHWIPNAKAVLFEKSHNMQLFLNMGLLQLLCWMITGINQPTVDYKYSLMETMKV